jgi:sulfur carrier protein ThiS adenylyltransferase
MNIRINEQTQKIEAGATLAALVDAFKPGADVLILNGFPASAEALLQAKMSWDT